MPDLLPRFSRSPQSRTAPQPRTHPLRTVGRLASRIRPHDVFAAFNLTLFALMCVFTYYARFVAYRGSGNLWEFSVYAFAIAAAIVATWRWLRPKPAPVSLFVLVEIGILAHFAGAFVQIDGQRLYDMHLAGIRYDKLVHFGNAFTAALVISRLVVRPGVSFDLAVRAMVVLTVLGLGAVVEILEYIVMLTIPGHGVGGYDNNMQDLIANLIGTITCVLTVRPAASGRLRIVPAGAARRPLRDRGERRLSAVECSLVVPFALALWLAPPWIPPVVLAAGGGGLFVFGFLYATWISPVLLHGDSLAERGLGDRRTWFVRTDNFAEAARRLGWFTLAGGFCALLLAALLNPSWADRVDWRVWSVRFGFYALSSTLQSLFIVGFVLVRLKRVFGNRTLTALAGAAMFAVLHVPNLPLVGLSAAFAFGVIWIAYATPNVAATALCQTLLGLLVHRVLELSMRIGYFYTHPDVYIWRSIFSFAKDPLGKLY